MTKILVAGGRDALKHLPVWEELNKIHKAEPVTELIEGGARGIDFFAFQWADMKGVKITHMPADWNKYGKRAGWIRNNEMADLKPDLVVLFPGGAGTAMMRKIALDRGLMIYEVKYD